MDKKCVRPGKCLISVSDKAGIVFLAQKLVEGGTRLLSTGGTAHTLRQAGISLQEVSSFTGFPEIMSGRVKTLHPKIAGGILADRSDPEHLREMEQNSIEPIDMIVVNLYPFARTVRKQDVTPSAAIEQIDIGGPTMIRAAAKNFQNVIVVIDPFDYQRVIAELTTGGVTLATREYLAGKVFEHMARYDSDVARYFAQKNQRTLQLQKITDLRYGENPHQQATLYQSGESEETTVIAAQQLQGKELSYNNIMDADAALELIRSFTEPAAAVIKHANPSGCAVAGTIEEAFYQAYEADPLSAFGGIIILNRTCTLAIAERISRVFAEIVLAPDFEPAALTVFRKKKNLRLLRLGEIHSAAATKQYRHIAGGFLEQETDRRQITRNMLRFVSMMKPTELQIQDMLFAWNVVRQVKSNAIVLAHDKSIIGVGAGQMSRVDAVDIAIRKASLRAPGSVAASDAFFPFRDGIDALARVGVRSIIQPGGSLQDAAVIAAVNEQGMSMVFTGVRAFKH